MASTSPTVHASRPGSFVDPHRQAEYPVLLGKSLQDTSGVRNNFFSVQYNWKPKNLSSKQIGVITKENAETSGDAPYLLTIQEPGAETKPYRYAGNTRQSESQNRSTKSSPKDQTTSLALVFDQEKSAFILEKISAALDFNLTSAPGQTRGDIRAHPQLSSHIKADKPLAVTHKPTPSSSSDDDEPDTTNPYDYRHFLEEAKANAEKGLGSRTPIPGGLSGLPSPVPGPSRFHTGSGPGTPVHRPVTSAPSAQVKKRKIPDEHHRDSRPATSSAHNKTTATKPKPKSTTSASTSSSSKPKPLSKERISDSDEEIGDTITLSRPSTANSIPRSKIQHKSTTSTSTAKPGYGNSPRIEVDEAADLVIDMGSPPPVARRRFGGGVSSPFAIARSSQPTKTAAASARFRADSEEEEEDAEGEPDDDVVMRDADADADGDVEDLVLGSPRASTTRAASVSMSRVDVDDDEDDELAAELEAALGSDDEDGAEGEQGGGVGLGISTNGAGAGNAAEGDDESEVSEEE